MLLLHRSGLSPHTPCRSPGALIRVAACTLALSPIRDTLIEGFSHFVTSMTAPIAFRLERIAGWALHPLESAALSRRTPTPAVRDARWNCGRGERYRLCRRGLCVTGGRAYEEAREGISTLKAWENKSASRRILMRCGSNRLPPTPACPTRRCLLAFRTLFGEVRQDGTCTPPPVRPPTSGAMLSTAIPRSGRTRTVCDRISLRRRLDEMKTRERTERPSKVA